VQYAGVAQLVERNLAKVDVAGSSPVSRSKQMSPSKFSDGIFVWRRTAPAYGGQGGKGMFTVYILKSLKDGKRYIGYTSDIERRLKEHNAGKTKSTKFRRPFVLMYKEEFSTQEEAERRELLLKSGKGREELNKTLPCTVSLLHTLGNSGKNEGESTKK